MECPFTSRIDISPLFGTKYFGCWHREIYSKYLSVLSAWNVPAVIFSFPPSTITCFGCVSWWFRYLGPSITFLWEKITWVPPVVVVVSPLCWGSACVLSLWANVVAGRRMKNSWIVNNLLDAQRGESCFSPRSERLLAAGGDAAGKFSRMSSTFSHFHKKMNVHLAVFT